jgi:hypothetical protein
MQTAKDGHLKPTQCLTDAGGARLRRTAAQCLGAMALLLIGTDPASSRCEEFRDGWTMPLKFKTAKRQG